MNQKEATEILHNPEYFQWHQSEVKLTILKNFAWEGCQSRQNKRIFDRKQQIDSIAPSLDINLTSH